MTKLALALLLATFTFVAHSQESNSQHTPKTGAEMTEIAKGTFEVSIKPLSFENADEDDKLGRMSIDKTISGDLIATTKGQMLTAVTTVKGSAGYVAIEHVRGTLGGRKGTFILQHTATMDRGVPSMDIHVVPDSGTDELTGLEGAFKIQIIEGEHRYEFIYGIADHQETPDGT